MTRFDCMSPDELAAWHEASRKAARRTGHVVKYPCTDCPMWFRLQETEAGRCNRAPIFVDPSSPKAVARREYNREWMRRRRVAA